jgi:radical SAM superfamily enzyme YgiQ (UPF0313 family)
MKILLTHTYYLQNDPKEQKINKPYPPLGLLYLSAWLEKHAYENEVFDATFSTPELQISHIQSFKPDILAIYANLITKPNIIKLVRRLRSLPDFKETLIVLGGPDVTYNIANYLAFGADVLVIGEGEQTFLEVVQSYDKGLKSQFGHITGLVYRTADGDIIRTKKRAHLRPIDQLPFPNRSKIDLHLYLNLWKKHHGRNSISVSTQRGCPYTCKWCSTAVYGQSYRRRSPALVVEEMLHLKAHYEFDQIWFVDDVFTVSHKWLSNFKTALQAKNLQIPFECITRADRLTPEIIQLLKDCGCFRVWIGAESGSQKILNAMDRRVQSSQVQQMIQVANQKGLETGTFIMLGYPGETEADIRATLNHLRLANPKHFTITLAYPIKGTGLYQEVKNKMVEKLDWFSSTDRDIDFERHYPRSYYDYALRWVSNGVYFYQQKKKATFNMATLKFGIKMGIARLGMLWHRTGDQRFVSRKGRKDIHAKVAK